MYVTPKNRPISEGHTLEGLFFKPAHLKVCSGCLSQDNDLYRLHTFGTTTYIEEGDLLLKLPRNGGLFFVIPKSVVSLCVKESNFIGEENPEQFFDLGGNIWFRNSKDKYKDIEYLTKFPEFFILMGAKEYPGKRVSIDTLRQVMADKIELKRSKIFLQIGDSDVVFTVEPTAFVEGTVDLSSTHVSFPEGGEYNYLRLS